MGNKRGRSFVIIMVAIAISVLVLRFAIEELLKINMSQNESNAASTLKLISAALENFAKDHNGTFPVSLSLLTKDNPPYLDKDYITEYSNRGYNFSCSRLNLAGYSCSATPIKCKLTGKMTYSVTTGALLISEECSGKE